MPFRIRCSDGAVRRRNGSVCVQVSEGECRVEDSGECRRVDVEARVRESIRRRFRDGSLTEFFAGGEDDDEEEGDGDWGLRLARRRCEGSVRGVLRSLSRLPRTGVSIVRTRAS